jgi:hypothetical protein
MGVALSVYVDDIGFYPQRAIATKQGQVRQWYDQLSPYVAKAKWGQGVYKCPDYKWGLNEQVSETGQVVSGCYAYNAYGFGPGSTGYSDSRTAGLGGSPDEGPFYGMPVKDSFIKDPSDMYAIGDAPVLFELNTKTHFLAGEDIYFTNWEMTNNAASLGGSRKQFITAHPRGYNMVFVDAHTEFVRDDKLYSTDPKYWRRWNRAHWAGGDPF